MLELGIDEITLVLQLPKEEKRMCTTFEWADVAEALIGHFSQKADLETVFGKCTPEKKAPQGYSTAYRFGEHSFYFAVAYHVTGKDMGIVVKFSAQALDYYCESTGQQVYEFLQKSVDPKYVIRLSRLDIDADFIDEGLNVTEIYQDLMNNKIGIFRDYESKKTGELFYRRCEMQFSGFLKERDVPTIYIGSTQSKARLRIYDKKREQFERKGSKLDKAKKCKNWVRFEGVFRSSFAHQLTDALMEIQDNDEFANLLAYTLIQKFRFMYIDDGIADCETEYTQMLIDCIKSRVLSLKSPSSRNFDLSKSIRYLFYGSGVISTLYKINQLWGDSGLSTLFDLINEYLVNWEPNDDCRYWLLKNTSDYKKNYPDFDSFLRKNLSQTL